MLRSKILWRLVYGTETQPETDPTATAEGENPAPSPKAMKTLTQDEVNKILTEERRKSEEKNKKLVTQLETFKKTSDLTAQQKNQLEQQIEDLKNSYLTKEQLLQKEKDKAEKTYAEEKERLVKSAQTWEQRFAESTVQRAIQDAAIANQAYSPEQLIEILKGRTRLVETSDESGKTTGEFVAKVKFQDVDKDGKPVLLDVTVPEAIKLMKERPDRFGNLFKSGVTGGLGAITAASGSRGTPDLANMSPAEYRKLRKTNPSALGLE